MRQLGDEDFPTRETAYTKLAGMGAAALTGLKQGENDPNLEIRKRVADLKTRIDTKAEPTLQAAAARVLAKLKTEGTADVLMQFLPFVNDTMVVDEICKTLGAVAVRDGRVDPMIVKALDDNVAVKRGAAGEAVLAPTSRARSAMSRSCSRTPTSMSASASAWPCSPRRTRTSSGHGRSDGRPDAESALAHRGSPRAVRRRKGPQRQPRQRRGVTQDARDAWAKWLAENEKNVDMSRLTRDNLYLGYTLIVQYNNRIGAGMRVNVGEVYELDTKKNVRWKFEVNTYPVDAQIVGGNRVVVAEYNGNRVTERDTKGKSNGNTTAAAIRSRCNAFPTATRSSPCKADSLRSIATKPKCGACNAIKATSSAPASSPMATSASSPTRAPTAPTPAWNPRRKR